MVKILIGCTGSVATIKLPLLVKHLVDEDVADDKNIKVCVTNPAKHFLNKEDVDKLNVYTDSDEWQAWSKRGDPVLHIELSKWADVLLIAPLDANTLAKISNGICDNLLTCVVRAWDVSKPLIFCPAMNTKMFQHPLTSQQINNLKSFGYHEIPVITKELMCGDKGPGAMAEVGTIVEFVKKIVENKL
ncbi:unnamed protein product [Phyllotreta striolata]|uniref:Phosphopantothenoylcysteine decarboxylase n=1 Tax=Phyllotreta striolata TaxID=444603 RepID=A0A9N9TKY2_PHYSR|nr:unnamed protein product [Phyllotreta striolata]